ncbi:MAG: VOC family protein [Bacteroidota bacterium]
MTLNSPFFADLSTYSPEVTMPFYEKVFGWKYYKSSNYYVAFLNDTTTTGLYETPDKFKQMRMPHFWMTYIKVESVVKTIEKAKQLGGIIELDFEITDTGKVGLIRDPQGAGFTVYEGSQLKNSRTKNKANTLIWNELHVSNAENVIPFYQHLFGWKMDQKGQGTFEVLNNESKHIADIIEIDNNYKGKFEYWVCTFGVEDLIKSKLDILNHGGRLIWDEGQRILFTDHSNEAFFYIKGVN